MIKELSQSDSTTVTCAVTYLNVGPDGLSLLLQGGQLVLVFYASSAELERHFVNQLLHLCVFVLLFVYVALEDSKSGSG